MPTLLLVGSVLGRFDALAERIRKLAEKKKDIAFALALCVGSFFEDEDPGAPCPAFVQRVASGEVQLPFPVYFTGSAPAAALDVLSRGASSTCNLRHLAPVAIHDLHGLQIALLGECGSEAARGLCTQLQAASGEVDFLCTADWPAGVSNGVDGPPGGAPPGSQLVTDVVKAARPRYHVAAAEQTFHLRAPYMNPDLGAGAHATRFISLAAVANEAKAKWAHALKLEPARLMKAADLQARTPDCTASPYTLAAERAPKRKAEALPSGAAGQPAAQKRVRPPVNMSTSVFVRNLPFKCTEEDVSSFFSIAGRVLDVRLVVKADGSARGAAEVQFEDAAGVKEACRLSGQELLGRQVQVAAAQGSSSTPLNLGTEVSDCWFCLSNKQVEVHLVVDVLEHMYVALDKGAIDSSHALVVSVQHFPNSLTLQPEAVAETHALMASLQKAYASRGLDLFGFERYLKLSRRGGNHCHLNFIGIPASSAATAAERAQAAARQEGFRFSHLQATDDARSMRAAVMELVGAAQYLQVFLPDGSRLVHPITSERHPLHFGRKLLADLVGLPERSDWKKCTMKDGAEEEQKAAEFRSWFSPFSPGHTGG